MSFITGELFYHRTSKVIGFSSLAFLIKYLEMHIGPENNFQFEAQTLNKTMFKIPTKLY